MSSTYEKSSAVSRREYIWRTVSIVILFAAALSIRLYDLTDLVLDFHPTRQLFSALKARGIFYQSAANVADWQQKMAVDQWHQLATIEPPVLEYLVGQTYKLAGSADLWIARIFSSVFWVLGGVAVYLLAKELTSRVGGVIAAAFFLFLPYGIIASRSFQPDPLMVAMVAGFLWALIRWQATRTWLWTVAAGVLGGFAIFVKTTAVFFVVGGLAGVILGVVGLRQVLRIRQVWLMGGLITLPTVVYYVYGVFVAGYLGQQFGGRFVPSLLTSPAFYGGWAWKIHMVVGLLPLGLALFGTLLFANKPARSLAFGLWGGYLAYGICFDYHNSTHDYYQLPLILITAICLAPLSETLFARLNTLWKPRPRRLVRAATALLLVFGLVMTAFQVFHEFRSTDYRPQTEFWAALGEKLGHNTSIVGLTQDYGYRGEYWGWMHIQAWPTLADLRYSAMAFGVETSIADAFALLAENQEYFLVTDFDELNRQSELKEYLVRNYPIFDQGDGYIIYDLSKH